MAIGVKIDFENKYDLKDVSEDLRVYYFQTILQNRLLVPLKVEIDSEPHEKLPNVYNLAFGPIDSHGRIDDKAELPHEDYSKVFSSILFGSLKYLTKHPDHFVGIDGSDNNRAYYYWRFLQRNFEYLDQYFDLFGIKYYVRITRYGKKQYDNPFDFLDIEMVTVPLSKIEEWPEHLFNYFIFRLKKA